MSEELAKLTKVVLKNEVKPSAEQKVFVAAEFWCRGRRPRRPVSRSCGGLNLYKPCRRIKAGERCSPLPPFVGLSGFVQ